MNPRRVHFKLYVAGQSPNSRLAVTNLRKLCESYLSGVHDVEVVDVFENPARALEDGVMLTPLLKVFDGELPVQTIVGNLSHPENLFAALGLDGEKV